MILVMAATPLAMQHKGFGLPDTATVMQWHVPGMFAPSFVTGHLIARYGFPNIPFPKRSDLKPYSQTDLDAIAAELNGRPRKTLEYMTPSEKFAEAVAVTR